MAYSVVNTKNILLFISLFCPEAVPPGSLGEKTMYFRDVTEFGDRGGEEKNQQNVK